MSPPAAAFRLPTSSARPPLAIVAWGHFDSFSVREKTIFGVSIIFRANSTSGPDVDILSAQAGMKPSASARPRPQPQLEALPAKRDEYVLACFLIFALYLSYTLGGFIHLLLLGAIAAVLIRVIQGRRAI